MVPSTDAGQDQCREGQIDHMLHGCGESYSACGCAVKLLILPPTAVALLSPDVSEIVFFPEQCAISLPRYSSLRISVQHVQSLL